MIKSPVNRLTQKLTARTMAGGNKQAATNDKHRITVTQVRTVNSGLLSGDAFNPRILLKNNLNNPNSCLR